MTNVSSVVSRKALLSALELATFVVRAQSSSFLILKAIRLESDGTALCLTASNLDMWLNIKIPLQSETFVCAVDFRMLRNWLRGATGGDVAVARGKEDLATFVCGSSRLSMGGYEVGDFPADKEFEPVGHWRVPSASMRRLIALGKEFASPEEARSALNSLHMRFLEGGSKLQIGATDLHRLVVDQCSCEGDSESEFMIPREAFKAIDGLMKRSAGAVEIERSMDRMRLTCDGVALTSNLVEGGYPNLDKAIPASVRTQISLSRSSLHGAMKRAECVGDWHGKTYFGFHGNSLRVRAENNMFKLSMEEEIEFQVTTTDDEQVNWDGAFRSYYLAAAANIFRTENVCFGLNNPLNAALLRGVVDGEPQPFPFVVVMPMQP